MHQHDAAMHRHDAPGPGAIVGPFADLMNDVAFQWVFGREANKDLLLLLLNEFIPDRMITDVTLYKQRQLPYAKGLKKSVFDVSCVTEDGTIVDIEVQVRPQKWFSDRCLYYSTFSIQSQVSEGQIDYTLKPVYVVSIDDFCREHPGGDGGRFLFSYALREDENHELMTDSLHFVFVELKNFEKRWEDIDNDKEKLYFCLKHLHEMDELPEGFAEGIWAKLADQARIVEMEPEVKKQYIRVMETELDKRAQLNYAREQGREEGLEQGREQGRTEGREEGRAEGEIVKQREIAAKMKSLGMPVETICEATGLSPETVADF